LKRIGLTGGIGTGKSAAAQLLCQGGIAVVDSDRLARQLVEPGQPALWEIEAAFGPDILDAQGGLRRQELGRRIFSSPSERQLLEAILHPRIRQTWKTQFESWTQQGMAVAAVDIPLLFETQAEKEFDFIVCVACSEITQRERLRLRGWSEAELNARLTAQWPLALKMERANYVLWNESSIDVLQAQWVRVFAAEQLDFHA
jgi:dephospho-CoA kinase